MKIFYTLLKKVFTFTIYYVSILIVMTKKINEDSEVNMNKDQKQIRSEDVEDLLSKCTALWMLIDEGVIESDLSGYRDGYDFETVEDYRRNAFDNEKDLFDTMKKISSICH